MELLPQTKVKAEKKSAQEAEIFRKLSVAKLRNEKEKEIADIVKDIDPEKKKIQREFAAFRGKVESRRSELLGEIKVLEAKRDTVMQPYYELKFQATEAIERAKEWEEKVKTGARAVNVEREKVSALKESLEKKEVMLSSKEQSIASLEMDIIERDSKLKANELDLASRDRAFVEEVAKKTDEITVKDRDLTAREATVESKILNLEEREQLLINDRKHLESQQITVKLAFEEARKKGIL